MPNQHLAHAPRAGLELRTGLALHASFLARAGLLLTLATLLACTPQTPDKPAGGLLTDYAKGVDAEFGVETFALSLPTLTVTSPAKYALFAVATGANAAIVFQFTTANFAGGTVRCYQDGTYNGATASTSYTFSAVPKGVHNLSCILTDGNGVEYANAEARGTVPVKVNPPCKVNADCDDGSTCSQDLCAYGSCLYGAIAFCCNTKFDCAVGSLCLNPNTTASQCTVCQQDADCNDDDTCTADLCDLSGVKGQCKNTKADLNCCSKPGDNCDDYKSCTVDGCNVNTGKCEHAQPPGVCCSNAECNSSDPCKVGACVDNQCRFGPDVFKVDCCSAGSNPACDDKNYCSDDTCDQPQPGGWTKCTHVPKKDPNDPTKPLKDCCDMMSSTAADGTKIGTLQCDDGQPCTADVCQAYSCLHIQQAKCCATTGDCEDYSVCTTEKCEIPLTNPPAAAGLCKYDKVAGCCVQPADCNDNKFCTTEACNLLTNLCKYTKSDPTCCDTNAECDDGKICTVKACINHSCVYGPDVFKPGCCDGNADCNDGKFCTVDQCDTGVHTCTFTGNGDKTCCNGSLDCDDDECTTLDFCDSTNHCLQKTAPGACKVNLDCNDGLACTVDTCGTVDGCGKCTHTPAPSCCTANYQCDDKLACTADACVNNACTHGPVAGCCVDDKDALTACDDANACTTDYCLNNQCRHTVPKNGCCSVDNDCSIDSCTKGVCKITAPATQGTCAYVSSCTCTSLDAAIKCNDNNVCTADTCANNACVHSAIAGCCIDKFDCDDGKGCTADMCFQHVCLHYTAIGGVSVCCNPATEAVDCAAKNGDCTVGKCVAQVDGTLACQAVEKPICTMNLNYCQDFSNGSVLKTLGWNPIDVKGTAATNWGMTSTGGLGPDQFARFNWTPTKTNYETCLASPLFQAAGAATLSIQYDREFLPNGLGSANTAISIKGSLDGATADWNLALTLDSFLGNQPVGPDNAIISVPSELTGSNGLRLAFCVKGNSSFDLTSFAVDNVCVVKGTAPSLTKCPSNQSVPLGNTLFVPIKAKDPDSSDVLSFSIVTGPEFVSLTSALYYWLDDSWNTTMTVRPLLLSDVGDHDVTVKVSDGYLYKLCTFKVSVTYQGGVLIWKPVEVPQIQADALKAAVVKQGKFGQIITDIALYPDLTKFDAVFVALGVYPDNHVLVEGEVASLKLYLAAGGKVYMEGGDTWAFDAPTSLHSFFKIKGVLDASPNGVTGPLKGYTNVYTDPSPAKNYGWAFDQDAAFDNLNDQITGNFTVGKTRDILKNDGLEKFTVQVGHDDIASKYRTIGSSVPFAGLLAGPDLPKTLMQRVLLFFANGFVDCKVGADCDDGNACTLDTCTAGLCTSDNTCVCAAAITLQCDQAITNNVTNSGDATQAVTKYSCDGGTYDGKEHGYKYTSTVSKPVTVKMTKITNPNARLFVLLATTKGCDPTGCLAMATTDADGNQSASFAAGKDEVYYFVVDVSGDAAASSQYDLTVTCDAGEDCSNAIDDNGNNLIDCSDAQSCCGDAACQVEFCNDLDDNCNGVTDEDCDKDGDGWCDQGIQTVGTPAICPHGGTDCNDQDGTINPATKEVCNNKKDDDCSGAVDEEGANNCVNYFTDLDADLYGTGASKCLCAPSGTYKATQSGDCNDGNINVNPSVQETCDTAVDDNCDGSTNDVNAVNCKNYYTDVDGDGFGTAPFKCMCEASGVIQSTKPGDCVDTDTAINSGTAELCDNLDQNCNNQTDEGCDDDKDTFCDADIGYIAPPTPGVCPGGPGDSDDADPKINPAGQEICDGKDNNSNSQTDEGCDDDKDGFCDSAIFTSGKPPICPGGGGDCDDLSNKINPGVKEECSTEVDDNCNESTNDLGAVDCTPWFFDGDTDKWGTTSSKCYCVPVGQYSAVNPGDCNDDNANIHPAVLEACDNIDNGCDGTTDEGCDTDGDGFCAVGMVIVGTPAICASGSGDCNDKDPTVNPSQAEVCGNSKDDNCSGGQNDVGAIDCITFLADTDGDTYGADTSTKCLCIPQGVFNATTGGDCNDGAKAVNPGATEACNNVDDDCDDATDEICDMDGDGQCAAGLLVISPAPTVCPMGGGDCNDANPAIYKGKAPEICDGVDDDCNGVVDSGCDDDKDGFCDAAFTVVLPLPAVCANGGADCDDNNNNVHPGATEICNNSVDDNCNLSVNDENALGCLQMYFDGDGDQFGLDVKKCLCAAAGAYSALALGDCNDGDPAVKPGATEKCDDIDNNCDAQIDEAGATGCSTFYYDEDKDGYGLNLSQCLCSASAAYGASQFGDCNDTNANAKPSATEVCDDTDNNCNTAVDEGCNKDGDKFCDKTMTVIGTPLVCSLGGGDCNDTDPLVSPIGNEICNGKDDDCSGVTDQACDKDGDGYCDADRITVGTPTACINGGGDCNDNDNIVNPGKKEVCGTAVVDDNCSGSYNDVGAIGCKQFYPDYDGDTYGKGGTSFQPVIINELRRNAAFTSSEYIEFMVTADLAMTDVDKLYFGDSTAAVAAKYAVYQLNLAALNIVTLKAGTIITVGGSAVVTEDLTYDPAAGNWNLAFVVGGVYVKPVGGNAGDFADNDVAWVDSSAIGTTSIDSITWGTAVGAFATAAKVKLIAVPTSGTTSVAFIGDMTSLNKSGSYQINVASSIGQPNGGANTALATFLRNVSTGGDTKCLCTADASYKTLVGGDCNDNNNTIYSSAVELCDNVDNNCNGVIDEGCDKDGDGYCDATLITIGTPPACPQGGNDCKDLDKLIHPGATEVCSNIVDENCDGSLNSKDGSGCVVYFYDADGDGFGVDVSQCMCAPTGSFTATAIGDCDDTKALVNPGKTETCATAFDDNCSGSANDVGATGCTPFYPDVDKDGFGISGSQCLCVAQGLLIAPVAGDCADGDKTVNPGASEVCDGKDNNCNASGGPVADQINANTGTSNSLNNWVAQEVIVGASGTFASVDVNLTLNSGTTYTQNVTLYVYSGALPGLAGSALQETITRSVTVVATPTFQTYTFTSLNKPAFTAGQKMVLVFKAGATSGINIQESTANAYTAGTAWLNLTALITDPYAAAGGATAVRDLTFTTRMIFTGSTVDEGCDDDNDDQCDANMVTVGTPLTCSTGGGDCKDAEVAIFMGAVEICDAIDNDCDGSIDELCDKDEDGYCDSNMTVATTAACGNTVISAGKGDDCDDANSLVYPSKAEICDDVDNNCVAGTDEACNGDGDGYCTSAKATVGLPKVCLSGGGDCNDNAIGVNPGAVEVCDGVDNNCFGGMDETCSDLDGDGYCSGVQAVSPACPSGGGDCNDGNVAVHPNVKESCATAYDDNCDGQSNEVDATNCSNWYKDVDVDGFGGGTVQCACAQLNGFTAPAGGDCNDADKAINPAALDHCDAIDNDCANGIDDGCDADGDLYCSNKKLVAKGAKCTNSPIPTVVGTTVKGDDCNDAVGKAAIHPGAAEFCDNLDNNCNTGIDEGCDDDDDNYCEVGKTLVGVVTTCTAGAGDCNDDVAAIKPGAATTENCTTVADDNCDGLVDALNAIGCTTYFLDNDVDTYGLTADSQCRCAPSGKYTALKSGDCNDADATSYSALAPEMCDGKDNNCEGTIDEGCDKDKDGYCDATLKVLSTASCTKTVVSGLGFGDDCDDMTKANHPGATEICDTFDNNCAGGADENCDKDGDGFCDAAMATVGTPPVCLSGGGDCNDTNTVAGKAIYPNATEFCNGKDDNCNVLVDEMGASDCLDYYFDGDQDTFGTSSTQCLCAPTGLYTAQQAADCNDTCPACYPGAAEICDGKDNNCGAIGGVSVDEGCNADGDLYCTSSKVTVGNPPICSKGGGDCNDGNGSIFPTASEQCNNADDNCNLVIDENAFLSCPVVPNKVSQCIAGVCK